MAELYERCEQCEGTRRLVRYHCTNYAVGDPCPFCRTGYNAIGLTDQQLQGIIEERDKLLEFVARVAERPFGDSTEEVMKVAPVFVFMEREAIREEAAKLVEGKAGRVEEYRARKGLKPPG